MPANPLHELRINARELLRVPGSTRGVSTTVAADALGLVDDRIIGDISVDVHAVSSIEGIVVTGTVMVPWRTVCRRCLTPVTGSAVVDVTEVYQDEVGGDDAFPIEGDQIDLVPAVREYVMLDLPDGPLCREDCAGICPSCGVDRNADPCTCDTTVVDERWAALDGLQFDDD
ncbi:MAG: DUF177 domain-containing protein [Ilumatobacteraceae bacterium]